MRVRWRPVVGFYPARQAESFLYCGWRKVFQSANRHIRHEHDSGVAGEQRFQTRENRFHLISGDHRHEHDDAVHFVEHGMGGVKPMMTLSRNIVNDGIAGGFVVEQIGRKLQVFALDDNSDLFHRMQR
jgi:hypothetical protein